MPLSIATDVSQRGDRPNRGLRMVSCVSDGLLDHGLINYLMRLCFDHHYSCAPLYQGLMPSLFDITY